MSFNFKCLIINNLKISCNNFFSIVDKGNVYLVKDIAL